VDNSTKGLSVSSGQVFIAAVISGVMVEVIALDWHGSSPCGLFLV